jgi:hypothetical protein
MSVKRGGGGMDALSFYLGLSLDEFIKASGDPIYERLNILQYISTCVKAMRPGPEHEDLVDPILDKVQELRNGYRPTFDTEEFIFQERADYEGFLYSTNMDLLIFISNEQLVSSKVISYLLAERFGGKGYAGDSDE